VDERRSASRAHLAYELDEIHRRVVEQQEVEAGEAVGGCGAGPQRTEQRQVDDAGTRPGKWVDVLGLVGRPQVDHERRRPGDVIGRAILVGRHGAAQDTTPKDLSPVRRLDPADISKVGDEFAHGHTLSAMKDTSLTGCFGCFGHLADVK
jgi:hypothetical protein